FLRELGQGRLLRLLFFQELGVLIVGYGKLFFVAVPALSGVSPEFLFEGQVSFYFYSKFALGQEMVSRVGIDQFAKHLLIWSVVLFSGLFEEFDARFAERHRHLNALLFESQLFRRRQKILDYPKFSERLIRVFYFLFHKQPFLFSSIQLQKSESALF
ncbi:MAG: hypothetical protein AAB091_06310, partial [Elusimicrobiota bacterium]